MEKGKSNNFQHIFSQSREPVPLRRVISGNLFGKYIQNNEIREKI